MLYSRIVVDEKKVTPFQLKVLQGDYEVVEKLLNQWFFKPDINAQDEYGLSALTFAIINFDQNMVQLLIKYGAHVTEKCVIHACYSTRDIFNLVVKPDLPITHDYLSTAIRGNDLIKVQTLLQRIDTGELAKGDKTPMETFLAPSHWGAPPAGESYYDTHLLVLLALLNKEPVIAAHCHEKKHPLEMLTRIRSFLLSIREEISETCQPIHNDLLSKITTEVYKAKTLIKVNHTAKTLAQGMLSPNSFFSTLPAELCAKIAALTSTQEEHLCQSKDKNGIEKAAIEGVNSVLLRPK